MYKDFSERYYSIIDEYVDFHENGTGKTTGEETFIGSSLMRWVFHINNIIKATKSTSIIDFGCGKAMGYHNKITADDVLYENVQDFWKINDICLYDPGVKKYNEYPKKKADGIICTDVIEHIPPEDINKFVEELFKLANKFIFVVAATIPAEKTFKNGENVHLTIKSENEWLEIFRRFARENPNVRTFLEFNNPPKN